MSPPITVAIPLHGSASWVDNVVANVRALPPLVTEIVISDQTCVDNAADLLRDKLSDDPRVVVHARAAGLGFVEHYHLLLEIGRGELFMWMPHDDIFDPSWVPVLVEALEAHPRAWLAFGKMNVVHVDGMTPDYKKDLPISNGELSSWASLQMMLLGLSAVPFRGLFHRQKILAAGLKMSPEEALVAVDKEWVFVLALQSAIVYDERAVCWKRAYPGSTSHSPHWPRHRGRHDEAAVALLRRYGPSGIKGALLRLCARLEGLMLLPRQRIAKILPARYKTLARQALYGMLRLGSR